MANSYLKIRRYNIDHAMLFKASQKVISDLGGRIINTSHVGISAEVPCTSREKRGEIQVTVYLNGAIYATRHFVPHKVGLKRSKAVVDSFLTALDDHIKSIPKESLRSVRDAFERAGKRYRHAAADLPS